MSDRKLPAAVFWDMDGTLVDSEPLHELALVEALESLDIKPPHDLHARIIGRDAYDVYEFMRREVGLDLPFDDWIGRKYDHYVPLAGTLRPRPGAIEIFRELREAGVEQAIVSNSDRIIVEANLAAVDLIRPGLKTVSRNDVQEGKPDPEPFLRAAYLCNVEPADAFVMEDSRTGASAGVAAGMTTIFWPQEPMEPPAGAHLANSAEDVRRLLGLI